MEELGNQRHSVILFRNQPKLPTFINLISGEIAIYSEDQSGFISYPKPAPPLGTRLNIIPNPLQSQIELTFRRSESRYRAKDPVSFLKSQLLHAA